MSTPASIAVEFEDGTVRSIYVHSDGFLNHHGPILEQNYNTLEKAKALIALGDLSILGPKIGKKRPFDNPNRYGTAEYNAFNAKYGNQCVAYGRDRDETDTGANVYKNVKEYVKECCGDYNCNFLFKDGKWYIRSNTYGSKFFQFNEAKEIGKDED